MSAGITEDTLFAGRLSCVQSRDGYRFSIDAVLLAHFAAPRPQDRVLDLGAGCGVVSLILSFRHPAISLTCLELQPSLAQLIRLNIERNGLDDRIRLVEGDLRRIKTLVPVGGFDLIVCNPPYYPLGRGQRNPNSEQAAARHELTAVLPEIVAAAVFAVRTKGRLAIIYPAARSASLMAVLRAQGLEPKRLRPVYPYPGADATLLLVEAMKGGGEELTIMPPLYIHDRPDGEYTPTVAAYYSSE